MILVLRSTPKYEFISKKASCAGCLISSWGFRCSMLTAFHFLLETATSIFISLLIHLFLLLVTIRDYSQYSVVIRVWSMANDGRLVSIPAFVSNSHPFPMAKLFIITHSVCWRVVSVFLSYSNTFFWKNSSLWTWKRTIQLSIPGGQQFCDKDVGDGQQSDTSVDVTHSSVCRAKLKLFQSVRNEKPWTNFLNPRKRHYYHLSRASPELIPSYTAWGNCSLKICNEMQYLYLEILVIFQSFPWAPNEMK